MTSLKEIWASSLAIPFRVAFKHAAAERAETATIWVQAISQEGVVGYGEGCPRDYVTGETVETALAFVEQIRYVVIAEIQDIASLKTWVEAHQQLIDGNPAAWCAVELALLDAMGKTSGVSVEELLGLPPLVGSFQYSAVLGDASNATFTKQLEQYSQVGFQDFKLKVSGDQQRDRSRIHRIYERVGGAARVRLDANNLWSSTHAAINYIQELNEPLFAIEEPLAAGDLIAANAFSEAAGLPVILDESFTRLEQVSILRGKPEQWMLNVRVSKLGGLLRSLAIVEVAKQAKLNIIVGAQVGETSMLTRAALTIASQAGKNLVAQEGAFGTLLLEEDICAEPLMFGEGGRIETDNRFEAAPGFGLRVVEPVARTF